MASSRRLWKVTNQPQPGDRILDMCASPGGKTTHIAQLLKGNGHITALDKNPSKVKVIEATAQRMKLSSCITAQKMNSMFASEKFPHESFDRILLDPPCSGLGNKPRLSHTQLDLKNLDEHYLFQRKLFAQAVPLLKKGGVLVYSTCTLYPQENEENVAYFQQTHPNMKLIPVEFGFELEEIEIRRGLETTQLVDKDLVLRFDPRDGWNGFFMAKFVKLE